MNKLILTFFFTLLFTSGYTQKYAENLKDGTYSLQINKQFIMGRYVIKFAKVIEDSRCSQDVNCVWAGQVKILVALLHEEYKFVTYKVVTYSTSTPSPNLKNTLKLGNLSLQLIDINPKKVSSTEPIDKLTYSAKFKIVTPE